MKESYPKKCSCCGISIIEKMHQQCNLCGWIDDPDQNEDRLLKEGPNDKCLEEYFQNFSENFGMSYCIE